MYEIYGSLVRQFHGGDMLYIGRHIFLGVLIVQNGEAATKHGRPLPRVPRRQCGI